MSEQRKEKRCIILENSSVAGTKPNGVSIESLLNPSSQADCKMLGLGSAGDHHEVSETSEKSSKNGYAQGMDNKGCSLNAGDPIGDREPVDRERQACFRDSRSSPGRITNVYSYCLQGLNTMQRLPSRNTSDGNDNDVRVPGQDSGARHNLPVPSASGCVQNLNLDMASPAMHSVLRDDSQVLQRTADYQNVSSPLYSRGSKPNRLGEQSCRKPKATKRRKYLKRIGVPRYRASSPLQPFSRRINHREHPMASNMENYQPPSIWRSSENEYATIPALAGPVAVTHPSSLHASNVYERASAAMAIRLPETTSPTFANRSTFGAVPNPVFYIVTDPSGFTFCTFQPPMNISPDFLVYQYPSTANMASSHVHIVHRQ